MRKLFWIILMILFFVVVGGWWWIKKIECPRYRLNNIPPIEKCGPYLKDGGCVMVLPKYVSNFCRYRFEKPGVNYVEGEVVVGIKEGAKIEEARKLFEGYQLKYKEPYKRLDFENKKEIPFNPSDIVGESPVSYVVYVSKGEERRWVEIFSKNDIVKNAELNHIIPLVD